MTASIARLFRDPALSYSAMPRSTLREETLSMPFDGRPETHHTSVAPFVLASFISWLLWIPAGARAAGVLPLPFPSSHFSFPDFKQTDFLHFTPKKSVTLSNRAGGSPAGKAPFLDAHCILSQNGPQSEVPIGRTSTQLSGVRLEARPSSANLLEGRNGY